MSSYPTLTPLSLLVDDEIPLRALGAVTITDLGSENTYFVKDGKEYYTKLFNPDLLKLGYLDFNSPGLFGEGKPYGKLYAELRVAWDALPVDVLPTFGELGLTTQDVVVSKFRQGYTAVKAHLDSFPPYYSMQDPESLYTFNTLERCYFTAFMEAVVAFGGLERSLRTLGVVE